MVKDSGVDLDESFLVRAAEDDNSDFGPKRPKKKTWTWVKSRRARCALGCCAGLLLFCGILIPITILVIVPKFAQSMIDNSQLMLMNATMMNPTNETVEMNTFLEMSTPDTGMFSALVKQTRVQVGTSKGDFGYLELPQMTVDSSQLWINMTSVLHVTNVTLFTEATASVLQGKPEPWVIRGTPSVHLNLGPSHLHFGVNLQKQFSLPKTLFVQMKTSNVVITGSTSDRVMAIASSSFFSSSVLEMHNIGDMTFNVTTDSGVYLGEVTVRDFHAARDFNVLPVCEVVFIQLPDGSNKNELHTQIKTFLAGQDQKVMMVGPIRSVAPFLSNIVSQDVTINGQQLMTHATAQNMVITGADESFLNATVTSSFYSQSPLSVAAVGGPQVMSLITPEGIEIGSVMLNDDVVVGFNSFSTTSSLHCEATDSTCLKGVNSFLTTFALGQSQTMRIRGPKYPPVGFMVDVVDAEITVAGSRLMNYVTATNFAIVSTNATHMWTTCSVSFVSESPITMSAVGGYLVMEMQNVDGVVLGHVYIEQDVTIGLNVVHNVRSVMFVNDDSSNVEAVRAFLTVLGSGVQQTAVLVGPIAGGSPLLYYTMRQNATMQGAKMMSNVVASEIVTTAGSETQLVSTSTTTFVSGMGVPKGAAGGPLSFEMLGLGGEVMGLVTVDQDVIVGWNEVSSVCTLIKSDTNSEAIRQFLGNFLSAVEQTITITGPVNTVVPFLSRTFTTTCLVMPETQPMVYFAVENKETVGGYSVKVDGQTVTYRGSHVTLLNPFPVPIRVSDMISDMYVQEMAFDFSFLLVSKHSCPPSTAFTRQITAKGMYVNNPDQDYVDLAPMATTSFFSPSVPQASQTGGDRCSVPLVVDLPCCFLATPIAAACRAHNNFSADHIQLSSNGTYTANIDGFVVNIPFVQKNVTVVYDDYVLSGFMGDGELGCSSITIKE